jgi:hypothetical protein
MKNGSIIIGTALVGVGLVARHFASKPEDVQLEERARADAEERPREQDAPQPRQVKKTA